MFFAKHAIYDKNIKVVANEVIILTDEQPTNKTERNAAFANFLDLLVEKTDRNVKNFQLLLPTVYKTFIDHLADDIKHKLIFKVALKASDPESYIEAEDLIESDYKVAVDIQDRRSIQAIPAEAQMVILDHAFLALMDDTDKSQLDKGRLLIKNISSYEDFNQLKELGVSYFSGRFIETPQTVRETQLPANKITVLKFLASLSDPDIEIKEIADLVALDNVMSYKLLKVVNSPLFRGVNQISSIHDAVVRFGYVNLKKWGLTLGLTNLSDKPIELTRLTLERAILCGNIGKALYPDSKLTSDVFYTTGLFSTLDAFFDKPMRTLLDNFSLDESIRRGILQYQGLPGEILKMVVNYQRGQFNQDDHDLTEICVQSNKEAKETFKLIGIESD